LDGIPVMSECEILPLPYHEFLALLHTNRGKDRHAIPFNSLIEGYIVSIIRHQYCVIDDPTIAIAKAI
jgi:hypothetical protein